MTETALSEDLKYIAGYNDLPYGEMENSTVLVTGATGLIGVSLVRALLEIGKIHVIAFVRNIEKAKKVNERITNSIEMLTSNEDAFKSFQFMNLAMLLLLLIQWQSRYGICQR